MPRRRIPLVFRALALFLASFPFARLSLADPVEARSISGAPREANALALSRIPLRMPYRQMAGLGAAPTAQPAQPVVPWPALADPSVAPASEYRTAPPPRAPRIGAARLRHGQLAASALAAAVARHGARIRALLVRFAASLTPAGLPRPAPLSLGTPHPHRAGALLASIQVRAPCRA